VSFGDVNITGRGRRGSRGRSGSRGRRARGQSRGRGGGSRSRSRSRARASGSRVDRRDEEALENVNKRQETLMVRVLIYLFKFMTNMHQFTQFRKHMMITLYTRLHYKIIES
jgi:hypothetical protein